MGRKERLTEGDGEKEEGGREGDGGIRDNSFQQPVVVVSSPHQWPEPLRLLLRPECVQFSESSISDIEHELGGVARLGGGSSSQGSGMGRSGSVDDHGLLRLAPRRLLLGRLGVLSWPLRLLLLRLLPNWFGLLCGWFGTLRFFFCGCRGVHSRMHYVMVHAE